MAKSVAPGKAKKTPKSPAKVQAKVETEVSTNVVLGAVKARIRVGEKHFLDRLTEKLTHFDANMILEAAMLTAGVQRQEGLFKKDEARDICLALIKRGGPAYAVGAYIYREVVG